MKKRILAVMLAVSLSFVVSSAFGFSCLGKPNVNLSLQSGTLTVNIGYGYWYLCSFDNTIAGITPESCEKIYDGLLLAEALNNKSAIYFPGAAGSCETIGSWKQPDVSHYFIDFLAGPAN